MQAAEIYNSVREKFAAQYLLVMFYDMMRIAGNAEIIHKRDQYATVLYGVYNLCRDYHPEATFEELKSLDADIFRITMDSLLKANNEFGVKM